MHAHHTTHRANAVRHAEKRARERFDAGPELVREIKRMFKRDRRTKIVACRGGRRIFEHANNDDFCVLRDHGNRVVARVRVDGELFEAVYDYRLKAVVTIFAK
jgi:hypothetical protein